MDQNETTRDENNLPKRKLIFGLTSLEILFGFFSLVLSGLMIIYIVLNPISEIDEKIAKFESETARLENDLNTTSEQISQFNLELSNYFEQIDQLELELETYVIQLDQLESDLIFKSERIIQLEDELETNAIQITQLKDNSNTKSERIAQLMDELETISEQNTQLNNELETAKKQNIQLEAELDTIRMQKAQLGVESTVKSERIAELEDNLTLNKEEIFELKQESSNKFEEISRLRAELVNKSQKITELLGETDKESLRIAQLQRVLTTKNEQIVQVEKELTTKDNQIMEMEDVSSKKSDQIALLHIENRIQMNEISNLQEQLAELEKLLNVPVEVSDWPPYINLNEVSKFSFEIGKATLSPDFVKFLVDVVADQIKLFAEEDDVKIVEVVGHTDDLPIIRGATSFDNDIIDALAGSYPIEKLLPTDNAGLGIARAVSVINVLKQIDGLSDFTFIPLSGGQLIIPDDKVVESNLTGDSKVRRRIEIRIRGVSGTKYFGIRN